MPAKTAAGPPAKGLADLAHECAVAGTDFDDVADVWMGSEGRFQPVGDALTEEGGKGGAGAEVAAATDGLDVSAVVTTLGIKEGPLHEAVEGLSRHKLR